MALKLSDDERSFLKSIGAISISKDGEEMLTGLTVEESIFLLQFQFDFLKKHSAAELIMIGELKRRHTAARWSQLQNGRLQGNRDLL